MIRNIGSVTLAIAFAAAGVAAQTGAAGAPQTPPKAPVGEVTIVGCVEIAPQGATGTAGTAASTKYNLTNAKERKGGEATGTTGGASKEAGKTYRLAGSDAKLAAEVGHYVEIVAVQEEAAVGEPTGTSGTAKPMPVLKVREIKMVAAKCPMP